MAANTICSRCLRLAGSTVIRSRPARTTSKRSIIISATTTPSRQRRIHQSHTSRAANVETQQQQTTNILPYAAVDVRQTGLNHDPSPQYQTTFLSQNDLFHSYTQSPIPQIRRRAAFIRQNAYCPHPSHQPTRASISPNDTEARKTGQQPPAHVRYECPDCGIPVSCCEEHFASDYENHLKLCDTLREINEDDHDLLSGRVFSEFDYPGPQIVEEAQVNMTNWDSLMYSRGFEAVNEERRMRQVEI